MTTYTVRYGPGGVRSVGDHTVSIRQLWQEDYTQVTDMHATSITWSCMPTMPTATIVRPYGPVKSHASNAFTYNEKLDVSRWYVKIQVTTDTPQFVNSASYWQEDYVKWFGVIADVEDNIKGWTTFNGVSYPIGEQVFYCYGMEYLLDQNTIQDSVCYNGDDALHFSPLPITFNDRGIGNRTINFHGTTPAKSTYVFDGTPETPTSTSRPFWDKWTTPQIVDYLLDWQGPSSRAGEHLPSVPFVGWHVYWLPQDTPVLEQEGATCLSLLNRLIDRRRMFTCHFGVTEHTDADDEVFLAVNPLLKTEIELDDEILVANPYLYNVIADTDELTSLSVRQVDARTYDRVIVRGARRTSTCTMFYAADRFEEAWTSAQETAYENAASGETGYGTWDTLKQQLRNQEVRTHEELRPVYSWFRIPSDWNLQAGAYNSGTLTYDCFLNDMGLAEKQYIHGCTVMPYLPLFEGVDYSSSAIEDGPDSPRDHVYRRPFITFKVPTDARYVSGENIAQLAEADADPAGDGKNYRWSAYARIQPDSRVVEVIASGEPQHVIATTDFTPLTIDRDLGGFDYKDREMLVTLTVQECRYAEGAYPTTTAANSTIIDAQRGLVLWAGEEFRKDYVVPYTVVDVDDSGTPLVSDGGYVRDDTADLEKLARIAYEWYNQDRYVVTVTTSRIKNEIWLGHMLEAIGDEDIEDNPHLYYCYSVVTRIDMKIPRTEAGAMQAPTMTLTTSCGELDPLTLMPRSAYGRRL